jgi:hypothetical protein
MAKYELSSDKNVVMLGDTKFEEFFNSHNNSYMFLEWAQGWFEVGSFDWHPKSVNKTLHTAFGSKIPLRFSAAMYNTFIKANIPLEAYFAVTSFGKHWKTFDPRLVNSAVEHNHLVQQAIRDNTLNVLPLMLHKKMDTQQLKAEYGKGLWKKLSNTSKSRMKLLARVIDKNPEWAEVRTCMLKEYRGNIFDDESALIAARIAPKAGTFRQTEHMIYDTVRMANRQGETVNPRWSYKRWEEEHSRLTKDLLTKQYSDKPFTDVAVYEEGGYTFTLFNNQLDIATEGKTMHHCVASYAGQASRGKYAVFRVEGKGERATLGLNYGNLLPIRPREFYFDQCYGMMNSLVSEKLRTAALTITTRHNDYLRLRDGRTAGQGDEGSRAVLDNGREGVPLNQFLRGNAIHAVWIDDLNWA